MSNAQQCFQLADACIRQAELCLAQVRWEREAAEAVVVTGAKPGGLGMLRSCSALLGTLQSGSRALGGCLACSAAAWRLPRPEQTCFLAR